MYIVYVKSDLLTNWINGPILLGANVVYLSAVHCSTINYDGSFCCWLLAVMRHPKLNSKSRYYGKVVAPSSTYVDFFPIIGWGPACCFCNDKYQVTQFKKVRTKGFRLARAYSSKMH